VVKKCDLSGIFWNNLYYNNISCCLSAAPVHWQSGGLGTSQWLIEIAQQSFLVIFIRPIWASPFSFSIGLLPGTVLGPGADAAEGPQDILYLWTKNCPNASRFSETNVYYCRIKNTMNAFVRDQSTLIFHFKITKIS
jgi:hypothetical protein